MMCNDYIYILWLISQDNWDDDDEDDRKPVQGTSSQPKKKSKIQIIAEKQAQKEAELKAKRAEIERMNAEMSPEEKQAEKLRLQKIQEESDLQIAVDMMGIKEAGESHLWVVTSLLWTTMSYERWLSTNFFDVQYLLYLKLNNCKFDSLKY